MNTRNRKIFLTIGSVALGVLAVIYLLPIMIVLANSFKGRFFISDTPFEPPSGETFVGADNYVAGLTKTGGFLSAAGYSLFITVFSVVAIVFFTSMTAWFIVRVKAWYTNALYYLFVFSMIVPFQMVMFTMSKVANVAHLDNPVGIVLLYLGFGAGLSVFIFSGFIKGIPIELEEAAVIDGCNPWQVFIYVIFPVLRPTAITVAILNTMWIWNDYLLPYLTIGSNYKTIPIAVQYLMGGHGSVDMGAMMAMLVLAMIPIVVFYLLAQKHIIKGVTAGAVKG
jgi:raffinose/stachyose/melibiose transport system permease protein